MGNHCSSFFCFKSSSSARHEQQQQEQTADLQIPPANPPTRKNAFGESQVTICVVESTKVVQQVDQAEVVEQTQEQTPMGSLMEELKMKLGENAEESGERVKENAEENGENAQESVEENTESVKESGENAEENTESVEESTESVKENTESFKETVEENSVNGQENFKESTVNSKESTENPENIEQVEQCAIKESSTLSSAPVSEAKDHDDSQQQSTELPLEQSTSAIVEPAEDPTAAAKEIESKEETKETASPVQSVQSVQSVHSHQSNNSAPTISSSSNDRLSRAQELKQIESERIAHKELSKLQDAQLRVVHFKSPKPLERESSAETLELASLPSSQHSESIQKPHSTASIEIQAAEGDRIQIEVKQETEQSNVPLSYAKIISTHQANSSEASQCSSTKKNASSSTLSSNSSQPRLVPRSKLKKQRNARRKTLTKEPTAEELE